MISANARLYEYVMPFGIVCSPPVYQFTNLPKWLMAPQNLIDKKSCERERFTMRMGAAAQCYHWGAVVGL